jgi:predicted glycosyltransferase involved in capsule biosynthesis
MSNHSIQIVLVLYRQKLENSLSYKTLCEFISILSCNYELLIYNNSSEICIEENPSYIVVNSKQNVMLAGAYNYALQRAITYNREWLLLLDQDTYLSKEYFEQINKALLYKNIVAIIPKLFSGQIHLSPKSYYPLFGPWIKMININKGGVIKNKTIQAFNTSALISVDTLRKIGGFPAHFPLDGLDTYVFYRFGKSKEQFYLMDVDLQHDLSVLDYQNKMTIQRYFSIIDSEYRFAKLLGVISIMLFKFRLVLRLLAQLLVKEKRLYISLTIKYLCKIN